MARHFHVVAVQSEGQKLAVWTAADRASAAPAPPDVPPGSCLIAVVNNGEWQSAIDVTHPSFFERVRGRYMDGTWHEMALYLLDGERANRIEDGRRILMNGMPVRDPASVRGRTT
jgi:hypothetical protein